jgi:carboxyl-terminal processing protease
MSPRQQALIATFAVVALALSAFSLGFLLGRDETGAGLFSGSTSKGGLASVRDAFDTILASSVNPPSEQELARGAIRGMIRVLKKSGDPYALFYSRQGFRDFQELTTGRFSGIGVWLKNKGGQLEIVSVLPGSPAREAGLQTGDVIRSVDGKPVEQMSDDEAVTRIKGPEGSRVSIGIDRNGTETFFLITRRELDLPSLRARVTEEELGYIHLFSFSRDAGKQVRDQVERFRANGVEGVVLDLRDNGGGLFSEAVEVASVFLEEGEIVSFSSRTDAEVSYEAKGDAFEDIPLVVIVNEGTASASEIVAGALQDRERAILVGATTYGKGSVQEVVPLLDTSALKLTTGAYVTPGGHAINGQGIEPDVEVSSRLAGEQRRRAIEILRGIVLSTSGAQG